MTLQARLSALITAVGADIKALNTAVSAKAQLPPLVTALTPGAQGIPNPVTDKFEVFYLADAANGVVWHLRYRSASASSFKWEVVGGDPLYAEVITEESTASTSYTALTTAGPSLTVPLAGDYLQELAMDSYNGGTAGSNFFAAQVNAVAINDVTDPVQQDFSASNRRTPAFFRRKMTYAANDSLVGKYKATGGTGVFRRRSISLMPRRVG